MPKQSIKIDVGGRLYDLPPLSCFIYEQHETEFDLVIEAMKHGRLPDRELTNAVRVLVHACISDRDPSFTEEVSKRAIGPGDVKELALALLTQSGFRKDEGDASGKAPAP